MQLILAPNGTVNTVRSFPYAGFLGLSAVKIDGLVRTKLDADLKPLAAKSITVSVRCYEARLGRLGVLQSNVLVDYSQVLWSAPDDSREEYADIYELELPFRISIPAKVAGFSTASFVSYRCTWRVEAVINHSPIVGLLRFASPLSAPVARPSLDAEISLPHSPRIRYSIQCPVIPIGPDDLVSIPISLLPKDSAVTFQSASVVVERRMQFLDPPSPPATPTGPPNATLAVPLPIPQRPYASSSSSLAYSPSTYLDSSPFSSSTTLQAPSTNHNGSLVVSQIAGCESSGQFARADSGIWSKTLHFQWPAAKASRWSIGETIESSELVSVKFFVRVKIVVSSAFGTDSFELEEKELLVMSTSEAERKLALSKYQDAYMTARSKSKSPRRTTTARPPDDAPPIPASSSRAEFSHRVSSSSHFSSAPPSKPPRRPHTSAGPRDKSRTAACDEEKNDEVFRRRREPRRDISAGADTRKSYIHTTFPVTTGSVNGASSSSLSASSSSTSSNASEEVREWEEELARIEMKSRFATKRIRPK
ncbi:hypothetical protein FB45DRAFT_912462 [Roridomyces roridus]|uniref:Uncharacterized protein n=1 Tax=Roridomyces roridus TaxID=1738132 RepID=A0AAD7FM76_9AGAR|nr:hypothetical protein FB45DRAFT_912462 [Roridomyces roridus]